MEPEGLLPSEQLLGHGMPSRWEPKDGFWHLPLSIPRIPSESTAKTERQGCRGSRFLEGTIIRLLPAQLQRGQH